MGAFVGVFPRDSTLLSETPVRESAAPPPGTSARVPQIGLRLASKPILGRRVTQPPYIVHVARERKFWPVTAVNLDLHAHLAGDSSQRQIAKRLFDRDLTIAQPKIHCISVIGDYRHRLLRDRKIFSVSHKRD